MTWVSEIFRLYLVNITVNIVKSKFFHSMLGWGISLAILAYLFSVLDWRIVIEELSHLNYLYLIPITIAFFGNFALRAVRWRYLLPEGQNLSFSLLFDSLMIGNLATFILPLRAGEFI
ncbi:MAG: hypothetical protein D6808_03965, partial [Candidatus Dadabacteria bacterium]